MTYHPLGSALITIGSTGAVSLGSVSHDGLQMANRVDINAVKTNAGDVIIGDFQIAADISHGGIPLSPGDFYLIEIITSLQIIFVNGTPGDKISINFWQGDRV